MAIKITKRLDAAGKARYLARYDTPTGRLMSAGTFGDRKAAERAALLAEEKAGTQQWVDPRNGKVLFKNFVEAVYVPTMGSLEASTRRGYRSMLRTHLLPMWGERALSSIKPSEVSRWVSDPMPPRAYPARRADLAAKPRSPQKTKDAYALLHVILDVAVRDGVILTNPCTGVRLPTQPEPPVVVMTPEEFDLLLSKINKPLHRAMLIVAVGTGVRWSELVGLTPSQIEFPRRRLAINRSVVCVGRDETKDGSRFERKAYPKGKKPRVVLLDDDVLEALSIVIADRGLAADSEEEIFLTSQGNFFDSTSFSAKVLGPALKRAGLDGRGFTMKTLRSSYCSWLLAGGADLAVVQALMGHRQITTTQKYIDVLPESYDAALKALRSVRTRSVS